MLKLLATKCLLTPSRSISDRSISLTTCLPWKSLLSSSGSSAETSSSCTQPPPKMTKTQSTPIPKSSTTLSYGIWTKWPSERANSPFIPNSTTIKSISWELLTSACSGPSTSSREQLRKVLLTSWSTRSKRSSRKRPGNVHMSKSMWFRTTWSTRLLKAPSRTEMSQSLTWGPSRSSSGRRCPCTSCWTCTERRKASTTGTLTCLPKSSMS